MCWFDLNESSTFVNLRSWILGSFGFRNDIEYNAYRLPYTGDIDLSFIRGVKALRSDNAKVSDFGDRALFAYRPVNRVFHTA